MSDAVDQCKALMDMATARFVDLHLTISRLEAPGEGTISTAEIERLNRINRQRLDGLVTDWLSSDDSPGEMSVLEAVARTTRLLAEDLLRRADEALNPEKDDAPQAANERPLPTEDAGDGGTHRTDGQNPSGGEEDVKGF